MRKLGPRPHPLFLIFDKVNSQPQHKNTVSADIMVGRCAPPLMPIHPHDTTASTTPESGTSSLAFTNISQYIEWFMVPSSTLQRVPA